MLGKTHRIVAVPYTRHPTPDILPLLSAALADDKLRSGLVATSLVAKSRLAPGSSRTLLASDRRLALAAAVGMVPRVHRNAADTASLAHPTRLAGLAPGFILMVDVADLTDGGSAVDEDLSDFRRG
jgi:hypothetical protein